VLLVLSTHAHSPSFVKLRLKLLRLGLVVNEAGGEVSSTPKSYMPNAAEARGIVEARHAVKRRPSLLKSD